MKKISVILMIVAIVVVIAAAAFGAGTTISTSAPVQVAGATFTPSQNVVISAASITTNYQATAAHASAASGPGYQYLIMDTFNGMYKKQWVSGEVSPGSWPAPVTSATTTVTGFTP